MKYSDKDLTKLADEAKKKLLENANKDAQDKKNVENIKAENHEQPTSDPNVDLYAEFRSDIVDQPQNSVENQYENHQLYSTQNYENCETQYQLRSNPTEDELEENPILEEYEEPIFEGGPSQGQVLMWKKQWAGYDILATEVADKTFIFRTMNRFEYKQLIALKDIDATRREEIICETCTLWPLNYNWRFMATDKAGVPSTYSKIIMQKSGFTQEYRVQVL